ncbi:uncharacterized protein LOC129536829 [Moschus berezovskii]|uniref:uncharacterized protein LOC129536829 n=1 Tax=Moschus berezovskii TaxID=68408 RepID=UPI00244501DC|nr:uncharacterized protein LOC129536829 [Moschus berezovskii]
MSFSSSCSFAAVSPLAPHMAFPPWGDPLRQARLPRVPSHHTGPCSLPGVSPAPHGCLGSQFSVSRPQASRSKYVPVLCSDLRAPPVTVSPHVHLRGLRDERLLDDHVPRLFSCPTVLGTQDHPQVLGLQHKGHDSSQCTCVGRTGQGKRPRGTRARAARSPVPVESPEMLNSQTTSCPRLPGTCEKRHTRDVPGGPLPGQGMRVDPRLGRQGLTCPGRPSPCAARPSTAKIKTLQTGNVKPGVCTGSCCHRHLCWHGPAGKQAFSIKHGAPRRPVSRSHWFRRGGGTRNPGPRHPPGERGPCTRASLRTATSGLLLCRRPWGGCTALREERPSALGRS